MRVIMSRENKGGDWIMLNKMRGFSFSLGAGAEEERKQLLPPQHKSVKSQFK